MSRWFHVTFLLAGQWVVAANTQCDDHAEFLTLSENYRRLTLVSRPWQRLSLNLSHCATPIRSHDHRNHHDCFTMPIFRLGQPEIMQCVLGFTGSVSCLVSPRESLNSNTKHSKCNNVHFQRVDFVLTAFYKIIKFAFKRDAQRFRHYGLNVRFIW